MSEKRQSIKSGEKFGKLTTVRILGSSKDKHLVWLCSCDCGNECERQTNSLRASNGNASCGCYIAKPNLTHGMRGSPTYRSWQAAKRRCHNPTDKDYYRYGAIGIFMCDEWRTSFENFYAEMGLRPADTTLDRIDNNLGYQPGNCRWATIEIQANNRKDNIFVEIDGEKITAKEFAERNNISHAAALNRISRGRLYV